MDKKLNNRQIDYIVKNMVSSNEAVPVRFLKDGMNIDLETGNLLPKGTSVINQLVYWNFPKWLSLEIEDMLNVKAVF